MLKLGQIPTPIEYVNLLLDFADYKTDVAGKRVLENSCGDGNVLVEIVRRYILDGRRRKWSNEKIRKGLIRDVVSYEVDNSAIDTTIYRLNGLCAELNIKSIAWDIRRKDYLKQSVEEYDYIIGNPPYITYHDLTSDQRGFLKEKFQSCKNGRFDYAYAFIEKSISELAHHGTLSYLIPFSVFRNKYAEGVRKLILPKLDTIVNYSGVDVFPNRTIGAAIIICKQSAPDKISYRRPFGGINIEIEKNNLQNKWIFERKIDLSNRRKFGDYFGVFNSVATLRNSVYLLKDYQIDGNFTIVGNHKIENQLIFDAVSPRNFKYKKKYKIVFPYYVNENGVRGIPEKVFKKDFPCAYEYFAQNKKELQKRKISSGIRWYEYGRSQALNSVLKEKLILPMIISGKAVTYYSEKNEVPFAGYYIVAKGKRFSLQDAANFLESNDFSGYAKRVGTPTTKSSYRLSVKDFLEYPLPLRDICSE